MLITEEMLQNEIENIPSLYGVSEFGRMLGWNRAKVSTYLARGVIPAPAAFIGGLRPVWTENQIVKFAHEKGHKIIQPE